MDQYVIFREATEHLCSTLDLKKALNDSFLYLQNYIPLDEMRINILDRNLKAVKTIAIVDPSGSRDLFDQPLIIPLSKEAFNELAGDALPDIRISGGLTADRATTEAKDMYFSEVPESSLIIMRLILDGRRKAALLLRAAGTDRFTEAHKNIVAELNKPFAIAVQNAITHNEMERLKEQVMEDNRFLQRELQYGKWGNIIGEEFGLAEVMRMVRNVASLDTPVMVFGETGTGKELIAHAVHTASGRREKPFIKVNCGAIPESLIDSELFGHEKGAFTGAVTSQRGRFERAAGGTLFLDEVGELPLRAQVRLLRVLQTKEFERVGGSEILSSDVRIIAATHRDLSRMVKEGTFREDLWYRLNVFPITVPPLRMRKADIPSLVRHFLEKKSTEMGIHQSPPLAEGAVRDLMEYDWPGNVRELENIIERALILNKKGPLRFSGLIGKAEDTAPAEDQSEHSRRKGLPLPLDEAIENHIKRALNYTNGKVGGPEGAAALLKVNSSTLRNKMKKLGIPYGRKP